jgi:hypothetical protein
MKILYFSDGKVVTHLVLKKEKSPSMFKKHDIGICIYCSFFSNKRMGISVEIYSSFSTVLLDPKYRTFEEFFSRFEHCYPKIMEIMGSHLPQQII